MLNYNTHKTILLQILKEIYTDTTLGPLLGFKGGTAAYLFYKLGRFSVDLDFDLLNETKENEIYQKIENILKSFGTIKDHYKKRHTLFVVLSYNLKAPNIKVEINRRSLGSRYEIKNYLGVPMKVMVPSDMFAHKLVAMLERKTFANRDIFDVWFFLKNHWEINQEIIEKRTGMSLEKYLKKCIQFLKKLSDKNILAGIGELLDEKTKIWAKKNLRQDTLFLLKVKLESLK